MKKVILLSILLILASTTYAQNYGELCQELSIDLIDLSNHQSDPNCQGFLGKSGSEVSTAGTLIDQGKIESAKSFLNYAHQDLLRVAKMNCRYKEEIQHLTEREEAIQSQL